MLRTDKPIYKVILTLNLLFIATGVIINVTNFDTSNTIRMLYRIVDIVSLLFALFYILYGYVKNAAGYYKIFGYLFVLSKVITTISAFNPPTPVITYVTSAVALISTLVLAFVKDLGKKLSFVLCGALVLIELINCGLVYSYYGTFAWVIKTRAIDLDIACLYGILTYAKYLDKAERGTK